MLLLVFLIILLAGIFWIRQAKENVFASLLCLSGGLAVGISLVSILLTHVNIDGFVAESHVRYDMLVFQYENDVYENDNDLGKRELMKDIQSWNEDLSRYQVLQDDFWIGIYYPDIFDQFELIPLERSETK